MGKLIRAVLRGRNGGNTVLLPDVYEHEGQMRKFYGFTAIRGFSSNRTITTVKHVRWLVEGFEQIVHHVFPMAATTEYSRCFQGGTADRVLSHTQKQGKWTADTTMWMPNVVFCPSATGRPYSSFTCFPYVLFLHVSRRWVYRRIKTHVTVYAVVRVPILTDLA
jgi:hypothetical protein